MTGNRNSNGKQKVPHQISVSHHAARRREMMPFLFHSSDAIRPRMAGYSFLSRFLNSCQIFQIYVRGECVKFKGICDEAILHRICVRRENGSLDVTE